MGAALPVRGDVTSVELRRLARLEADGRVACRILALANALDGMSREQAAKQAGMDRQTLRDWVIRFNAEGMDGLRDRPRSGRPAFLDEGQMAALKALVLRGPNPERAGVSSWTAKDLCRIVENRFGVSYSENGMLDLLHGLGLSWQKTRPIHPQANSKAQQAFKKTSRHCLPRSRPPIPRSVASRSGSWTRPGSARPAAPAAAGSRRASARAADATCATRPSICSARSVRTATTASP